MTDSAVLHLIQDLRAHAHEAPPHCAQLMRSAAAELDLGAALGRIDDVPELAAYFADAAPKPVPIPPPDLADAGPRWRDKEA